MPFSSNPIFPSQVPLTTNSFPSGKTTAIADTNLALLWLIGIFFKDLISFCLFSSSVAFSPANLAEYIPGFFPIASTSKPESSDIAIILVFLAIVLAFINALCSKVFPSSTISIPSKFTSFREYIL